jgi:NADPH:quinone reductase-like Zn-dependent oxidoreductase
MKAAIVTGYGGPEKIRIADVPKPVPRTEELLVRVQAATVNRTDCGELYPHPVLLARLMYGLRRPRRAILGLDFAGEVEAAGSGVTRFKPGERVFGMCPTRMNGAQAEYVCVPQDGAVAQMPDNLRFDEVVVCEGAYYAQAGLDRLGVKAGHAILIYGASGAIGTAALQLAKIRGAEVTAVVGTKHLSLVRGLGADHAVDYTAEDFTRTDSRFDFVFDAVGKTTFFRCRKLLKPKGMFAATDLGPYALNPALILWSRLSGRNRVVIGLPAAGSAPPFVGAMKERLEAGQFRAVIDRSYPLAAIAEAYRYVDTGQKTGIVVIDVIPRS